MKGKILVFILFFTLVLRLSTYAQDFYVNPAGDDSNLGTKEKPVATLEAARDLIRQYKAVNDLPKSEITVWISKGQYDQKHPFVLNENDSGQPGALVVWRTMKDEKVSIT